jgi:hypothetical protein
VDAEQGAGALFVGMKMDAPKPAEKHLTPDEVRGWLREIGQGAGARGRLSAADYTAFISSKCTDARMITIAEQLGVEITSDLPRAVVASRLGSAAARTSIGRRKR